MLNIKARKQAIDQLKQAVEATSGHGTVWSTQVSNSSNSGRGPQVNSSLTSKIM